MYCKRCLRELFSNAVVDETLFPPRCCRQRISLDEARPFLGRELSEMFEEKALEWETMYDAQSTLRFAACAKHYRDRVYCPRPTCSTFIPPNRGSGYSAIVVCPICAEPVCSACKRVSHAGPCDNDRDTEILNTIRAAGFQRCECGHVIELTVGCYHMTCRCGRQFCYLCSRPWKTCNCKRWDERRLVARAQEVDDRDNAGYGPGRNHGRQQRVAAIARNLREYATGFL